VRVEVDAAASAGLDRELEVVLLRTAQEGLANVRKHAGAGTVWVSVTDDGRADRAERAGDDLARSHDDARGASPDARDRHGGTVRTVRLTVRDDGVGPADAGPGRHGFGLAGIRDRVALVGGRASFGAAPGGGSLLEVEVPVPSGELDPSAGVASTSDRTDRRGGSA
jgi:glucose-6-phosphate-specific signal transduction histidine kinase